MIIQHNLSAMNAQRNLSVNNRQTSKYLEKLSTGYKINRAADDAAGLAISEKMRSQIRGLAKAENNCMDAISLVQTAEGALNEIHSILHRGRELLVQASNGTYQEDDRLQLQLELDAINKEIDRIAVSTKFNGIRIFTGKSSRFDFDLERSSFADYSDYTRRIFTSDINYYEGEKIYIRKPDSFSADAILSRGAMESLMGGNSQAWAVCNTKEEVIERMQTYWLPNAMEQIQNTLQSFVGANHNIVIDFDYTVLLDPSDPPGTDYSAVTVHWVVGNGANEVAASRIGIVFDLDDYIGKSGGFMAQTVAHELTHAFMDELMPRFMSDSSKPTWFSEGVAELVAGGMENVRTYTDINLAGGDAYKDGYLGVSYAAYLASGADVVSADSLSYGLDLILAKLRETGNIDQTFEHFFGMDATDFATNVTTLGARMSSSDFVAAFQAACGTGGAGSIIAGNLSVSSNYVVSNRAADYTSTVGFVFHFSNSTAEGIYVQAGANGENVLRMQFGNVDSGSLGIGHVYIGFNDPSEFNHFIDKYDQAIFTVSSIRAQLGAVHNRLMHTYDNLTNTRENLTAAESVIRDADMAKSMMEFTKNNILVQSSQAMLAQASSLPQGVLQMLQ